MSDLTQWTYKRSHSITSGTELTDYQVKIRVYRTEGTSTGDTVYLNERCKSDFSDIRFTDFIFIFLIYLFFKNFSGGNNDKLLVSFELPARNLNIIQIKIILKFCGFLIKSCFNPA